MGTEPNAAELTVEQAWYIAETVGAGSFPWVLAITMPYTDAGERGAFMARQRDELTRMGVVSPEGTVNPAVAEWIRVVCFPDRWLDLRYVGSAAGGAPEMLRGIVARRDQSAGKPGRTDRASLRGGAACAHYERSSGSSSRPCSSRSSP